MTFFTYLSLPAPPLLQLEFGTHALLTLSPQGTQAHLQSKKQLFSSCQKNPCEYPVYRGNSDFLGIKNY